MYLQRVLKNNILRVAVLCAVSIFLWGCGTVQAATLQIHSSSATLSAGDTATLQVILDSEGVAVNNAEAIIQFPTELVDVISINKAGSVFSLWVEDPTFSAVTGTVTFNGGVPTPGFNGAYGPVVSIVVRAKKAGTAEIAFSSASVRANDGLGTDVLRARQGKSLAIVSAKTPVVDQAPANVATGPTVRIVSTTHPDQNQWYTDKNPVFRWTMPEGSDAVQTSIDNNDAGVPRVTYNPAITEKATKDLNDGVWYFKARARTDGSWGPTDTYVARIDTKPPVMKDTKFSFDDATKMLTITTDVRDLTSGMDKYLIFINGTLAKTVPATQFTAGSYNLKTSVVGENAVRLVATDRAGNSVEAAGTFASTGDILPQLEEIQSMILANEQLLIRGTTHEPNEEVVVYIKNLGVVDSAAVIRGEDNVTALATRSDANRAFFVLTPKLEPGKHDIWVEVGSGDTKVSSVHHYTQVSARPFVTIGSMSMSFVSFVLSAIAIVLLTMVGAFRVGTHYHVPYSPSGKHVDVAKSSGRRALLALRKRIEKHLEVLQETRESRILTKGEKQLKQAMELDLDAVDQALEEQK